MAISFLRVFVSSSRPRSEKARLRPGFFNISPHFYGSKSVDEESSAEGGQAKPVAANATVFNPWKFATCRVSILFGSDVLGFEV
jgi:hypothetical protein